MILDDSLLISIILVTILGAAIELSYSIRRLNKTMFLLLQAITRLRRHMEKDNEQT